MPQNPRRAGISGLAFIVLACCLGVSLPGVKGQTGSADPAGTTTNQPAFNLQVGSNLVVVRVVVRDANGNAVENLHKEDFRLLDNGKAQSITQFETKAPGPKAGENTSITGNARAIALFFDDLDTPRVYLSDARDAANHFLNKLGTEDHAALLTASENIRVDFTSDLQRLHDGLSKIVPNEHGEDPRLQAWRVLQRLDKLVTRLSHMSGQRIIVLVSTGFMSGSQQAHLDAIVDRALHSQIVINALDPRGLLPPMGGPEGLVGPSPPPFSTAPPAQAVSPGRSSGRPMVDSLDPDLLIAPATALQEVADGTGGEYFHDNNDLAAGFRRLSGVAEVYYILAFQPRDLVMNGGYHSLKVAFREKHAGFKIQARRGYFAPVASAVSAEQVEKHIHQALFADSTDSPLPVVLGAEVSTTPEGDRSLLLLAHLDARPLHFHREGKHNLNTLTFVFGIFDESENIVGLQRRHAFVNVLDSQLPDFLKTGVTVDMKFQVKPGVYRVREVVADSEDRLVTTLSRKVKVP